MRWQGSLKRALRASAALLLAAGCGQILGVSDYRVRPGGPLGDAGASRADASPGEAALDLRDFTNQQCGTCVEQYCKKELGACAHDAPCYGWEYCMARCAGDGNCENGCFVRAGKTDAPMGSVAMCTFQYCYDDCEASGALSAYGAGCAAAMRKDLEAPLRDCADDGGCRGYYQCLYAENCLLTTGGADSGAVARGGGNKNPSCWWDCADEFRIYEPQNGDGGLDSKPLMALGIAASIQDEVYKQCAFGDMTCVGRYSWNPASRLNQQIDVTVRVHAGPYAELPGPPLPNVRVRACAQNGSHECDEYATASSSETTAADGTILFKMPTLGVGLRWYFEVTPSWPLGPSGLLFFTDRPLTQNTFLSLALGGDNDWAATIKDQKNALTGGDWDPNKAGLYAIVHSCSGFPVHGLTVLVHGDDGGATVTRYITTGSQPVDAPGDSTYGQAIGGITPGLHIVSAHDATGKVVAEEQNVMFQADAVTHMEWFAPTTE